MCTLSAVAELIVQHATLFADVLASFLQLDASVSLAICTSSNLVFI